LWEEYSAVQDQLEFSDAGEMQQHELDRKAFKETCCKLRASIERLISEDRRARDVISVESQTPRAPHKMATFSI
jgi:cupin superfamily acireductone dioxygenase involved in methionine salvage